jgi:hypothetical protein
LWLVRFAHSPPNFIFWLGRKSKIYNLHIHVHVCLKINDLISALQSVKTEKVKKIFYCIILRKKVVFVFFFYKNHFNSCNILTFFFIAFLQ